MKKTVALILISVLLSLTLVPSGTVHAASTGGGSLFRITDQNGAAFKLKDAYAGSDYYPPEVLYFTSNSPDVTATAIELVTSTDISVFPFRIDSSNYYQDSSIIGSTSPYGYAFAKLWCRGDAVSNYYTFRFNVYYTNAGSTGVEVVELPVLVINPGTTSSSESTPKIIISSFSTNPGEVVAGEEFTLNATFKNTSTTTTATNIKAQMSSADGTFTPVSGSTTIFIDSLAPGAVIAKSIRLMPKADAAPGSYSVNFGLNFDGGVQDATGQNIPITDTEVLSVPVKQIPRVQVSSLQVAPTEVYLGREVNVMTSVNNTGKSTLYNVNVVFSDPNGVLGAMEQFIGNVTAGSSGSVDVYVPALMAGEGTLTMTVTYEDENGQVYTHEETAFVFVMEQGGTMEPFPLPGEDTPTGLGLVPILLIVLGALAVAATLFILLRKRKKAAKAREDELRMAEELEKGYLTSDETEMPFPEGNENATRELDLSEGEPL